MGSPCRKPLILYIVLLSAVFLFNNAYSTTVKDIILKYGKYEIRDFIRASSPDRQITIQIDDQLYKKKGRQDINYLSIRSIESDFRWMGLSPADADRALESYRTESLKTAVIEAVIYGNDQDTISAVLNQVNAQKNNQFSLKKNREEDTLNASGSVKNSNYPDSEYPLGMPVATVADLIRKYGKYDIRNFIKKTDADNLTSIQVGNQFFLRHGRHDITYITAQSIEMDFNRIRLSPREADKAMKTYLEREGKHKPLIDRRDQHGKNSEKDKNFNEVVHQIFDSQIIDDASFSDGLGYIIFRRDENYFGAEYQIHKIATIDSARLFHKFQRLNSIKMLILLNFDTDFYTKGLYILNADRKSFESEYGVKFYTELDFQKAFVEKYSTKESMLHFGKKFINHVSTGESIPPPKDPGDKKTAN